MTSKSEPWYFHAALYAVIVILIAILIKVAIIDPKNIVESENYFKNEARLRMKDLKEGEILYQKKFDHYTGDLDTLINFIKSDKMVDSVINSVDSLSHKSSNPFVKLTDGEFIPDSLYKTPKSQQRFTLEVDSSITADTVVDKRGRILRIEKHKVIGTKYYINDPDGYGSIGSLDNDALKNTASWE
jgi:hypothetical protein